MYILDRRNHGKSSITKPDDSEERLLFKGLTSGQEVVNYVNGVEVPSCFLWEGTELLIESWMKIGECKSSFRDYWSLSSDGSTLTMEHCADDLAGLITILEKTT
jgi:hypothetical protein